MTFPNMVEEAPVKENGLYCFKDANRPCNADCMAYQTFPPEGPDYDGQWAHCRELVYMHRAGKHLTILAAEVSRHNRDQQRLNQPAPPVVR